jgi:hypothetical protein
MREDKEVATMDVSAVGGEGIWSYTQKQQENVVSFTLNFSSILSATENSILLTKNQIFYVIFRYCNNRLWLGGLLSTKIVSGK